MKRCAKLPVIFIASLCLLSCDQPTPLPHSLAGSAGIELDDRWAYVSLQEGLSDEFKQRALLDLGRSLFVKPWVSAPSTTFDRDGLGPLMNANSCSNCHPKNGQARVPLSSSIFSSPGILLRLSQSGEHSPDNPSGVTPSPAYGTQLQPRALVGMKPEGQMQVTFINFSATLPDGEVVDFHQPDWQLSDAHYGSAQHLRISARMGPRLVGMGLLDELSDQQILSWQDEQDDNNDGISGKAARVFKRSDGQWGVGRYGWKAEIATLKQQVASAFHSDMGLTSSVYPEGNCSFRQQALCQEFPHGGLPEVDDRALQAVTDYLRYLAVPYVRNVDDPDVQAGWQLFHQLGCQHCHKTSVPFQSDKPYLSDIDEIHPFTDLLLHDMGPRLSDQRPVFNAKGSEWRTAPLWGIGLAEKHLGQSPGYLHDGRARTLQQAILWHGGEAEQAMQAYAALERHERQQLLAFLQSL